MIEYVIQAFKWILDFWGLLPEETKTKMKAAVADSMEDVFRKYYGSSVGKASEV